MNCALALVLLLDASASIDAYHWQQQIEAHAEALEHPQVQAAIRAAGPIRIRVEAFADRTSRMITWRQISTDADAFALARDIRAAGRPTTGGTNIGHAITYAIRTLDHMTDCERRVIDLVTDGDADAPSTESARDAATAAGITINALGIGALAATWLRQHAQTTDGFTRQADDWRDVGAALRAKMVSEIAGL